MFFKDPKTYWALFGQSEKFIAMRIQQSGRLRIIRRFENLDSVDAT